ncbi:aconitase X catalytic domain-containing protein [Lacisediminimonas sp.]|uniref:aconitase X catalytic domain-containing protein n=1 Tax=Lacisediminimonas sp. TaxID=3060582 RepID=UPI002718D767|nr:aconitase X catalytic domain-containing protein [Lacisediminimonas sp.]MDO8300542.1 aconitase X catalytic domain-containing protein [Lacisediminimonas sp.]
MELNEVEQEMLAGKHGEAIQKALAYQIEVGKFFHAERFVPITNAHMMGDIEVMGDGGLDFLKQACDRKTHCSIPITTNARCMDFNHVESLGQDAGEAVKEKKIIAYLKQMNVVPTDTCINYQTVYQPTLGEHVAWGDTGTVIYANSVFGARSNFESGPAAFSAAVTGRTPAYGFHLDECRRGSFVVRVDAKPEDLADWGALGKLVGETHQSYYAVPVFTGMHRKPSPDELKHLGAALASYGSMGMFHMVGVTPEAPTVEAALGGRKPDEEMVVSQAMMDQVYRNYDLKDRNGNLVVFSGPQLSLLEMKDLSERFKGRKVAPGTQVFVTTYSGVRASAESIGYTKDLEDAGVQILEGVCFYILQNLSQMRIKNGWVNMVSNSAKIVNIIGAHRFNTILRRTQDCVDIACTGRIE